MSITEEIIDIPAEHIRNVFGEFDHYIKNIERALNVTIIARGGSLKIIGEAAKTKRAVNVLNQLIQLSVNGEVITDQNVNYTLALSMEDKQEKVTELYDELICHTIGGRPIKPKTHGQKNYIRNIREKMIVFGVGPAGTGKTYLAMAMAITAFRNNEVNRIILTRPAIEAGEKLGFLPGDLQSKIDPYLRPLYDALYADHGSRKLSRRTWKKGLIEVAPLAYMRGRTLDNSFIVLDEAQRTTPAQMKMFLTRIGFGSKVIVTGDLSQKDLPTGQQSGLDVALKVLGGINEIGICMLSSQDVVRHPLVQKIVKAYDDYEAKQKHLSKDGLKKDEAARARTKRSSVRRKISERGDK